MQKTTRKDATRHRGGLIDAAASVFREHGVHASLDLVSARAGLGKATLYRHFEDRQALVLAVLDAAIDHIEEIASQLCDGLQLRDLLELIAGEIARNPALADAWRVVDALSADGQRREQRLLTLFEQSIAMGIDDGTVRADLCPADGLTILRMFGALGRKSVEAERVAAATRMTALIFDGLSIAPARKRSS